MPSIHDHDHSQPDPIAGRRTDSADHYDAVDTALAAQPKAPSGITRVIPLGELPASPYADDATGVRITIDDEHGTRIDLIVDRPGRLTLLIADDTEAASATLPLFAVGVLADTLRRLTGRDTVSPIVGHR